MTHLRSSLPAIERAALFTAVAAGLLYLAARPDACAADKSDPPKAEAGALDFVPADAVAVFSIRIADLWNYPPVQAAREKLGKDLPEPLKQFNSTFGVGLEDMDRFTFITGSTRSASEEWFVVTTVRPCDKKAVLAAAALDAKEQTVGDHTIYVNPRGLSVCFLDERNILFGQPGGLQSYLKRAGVAKEGPLTPVLKLASEKHVVIAGMDVTAIAPIGTKNVEGPGWLKPLLKTQLATLTVDLDGQVRADARLTFDKEADAKEGAAALDAALDDFRGGFAEGIKRFSKEVDAPKLTAILEDAQAALKAAKSEQKGTTVEVAASLKIDPEAITAAAIEAAPKIQEAAKRIPISNDLKQLSLAAVNYADTYGGKMLPAAVYDKSGKPLLSWRVLVLPYIEQGNLYNQFKLDEPWDSDNNKKLIDKMPTTFAPADSEAFKKHETFYQAFVGKGSVFEEGAGVRYPASITDGTSNTILFVEAAKSVPWTKPDDIPFDEGKLLPRVGGLSKGGFLAAFCDCHVQFLPRTIKEETLRALVTCNGGEVIPDLDK